MRRGRRAAWLAAALVACVAGLGLADRATAQFHAERGDKALKAGQAAEAEQHFTRALEEDATYAPARFGLARALLANGHRDQGLDELRAALDALGGEKAWKSDLAAARKLLDDTDRAGAELRAQVDAHVEALVAFARKWRKKDEAQAVRALRAALALRPGDEKAAALIEELGQSPKGPAVELFDGRSTTGWVAMTDQVWTASGGTLTGSTKTDPYIGRSERYVEGDFDVSVEARLLESFEGPDYFALAGASDGKDAHYVIGLLRGKLFFEEQRSGDDDRTFVNTAPAHDFDAAQWHRYEMRFRGDHVTAYVDGVELAADAERPASKRAGFVGLIVQNCKAEFRHVRFTPW